MEMTLFLDFDFPLNKEKDIKCILMSLRNVRASLDLIRVYETKMFGCLGYCHFHLQTLVLI